MYYLIKKKRKTFESNNFDNKDFLYNLTVEIDHKTLNIKRIQYQNHLIFD